MITQEAPTELNELRQQVQHNCTIADATHARNQSLCTYLLNMREYYRWAHGLPLDTSLPTSAVGQWIRKQEHLWDRLEGEPFQPLIWNGVAIDPFEDQRLNESLEPIGWFYCAGIGRFGKPHFCLAQLQVSEVVESLRCWHLGREIARDSTLVPATYRAGEIVIRTESIRRLAWEKWSLWQARPQELLARRLMVAAFTDSSGKCALDRLTAAMVTLLIRHEVGEARIDNLISPTEWHALLTSAGNRANELFLRLLRDQLANALVLIPFLASQDPAMVHLHFALAEGMERRLVAQAYQDYLCWANDPQEKQLLALAAQQQDYWQKMVTTVIARYNQDPETFAAWLTDFRETILTGAGILPTGS